MSDKSLLTIIAVVAMLLCSLLEMMGKHVDPGPCYIAAVAVGAVAALAWAGRSGNGQHKSNLKTGSVKRRRIAGGGSIDSMLPPPDPEHPSQEAGGRG